jgi:hypothetical protein
MRGPIAASAFSSISHSGGSIQRASTSGWAFASLPLQLPLVAIALLAVGCNKAGESVPTAAPVAAADRQAAYDERLEAERGKRGLSDKTQFEQQYGRDKTATITITGLTGDAAALDYYINRKLFKAAWADYDAAAKRAQAQNEANKQAAEQKAVQEHKQQWGDFGSGMIWYRYQPVNCDLPYPTIKKGTRAEGTFVYYVAPVLNLDEFSRRFDIGRVTSIDQAGRALQLQSLLPDPVPDIDLEELLINHGKDNVAKIVVTGATQEKERVSWFLEKQAARLHPSTTLELVGPKMTKVGEFEMFVGPASDLEALANRIDFGKAANVDPATRTITVQAALPAELPPRPSPQELHAERMKAWDKPSDMDTKPHGDEDEVTWALRILKGKHVFAVDAVHARLKGMKPSDEDKAKLVETLIATHGDSPRLEAHLESMLLFQTPEIEKAIINLLNAKSKWPAENEAIYKHLKSMKFTEENQKHLEETIVNNVPKGPFPSDQYLDLMLAHRSKAVDRALIAMLDDSSNSHATVIKAVGKLGTTEAAMGLIGRLGNFFDKNDARQALVTMGPKAEDAVLKLVDNPSAEVRVVAYGLLTQVGTEKSLTKLKAQQTKDRDRNAKPAAKQAYELLKSRLDDEKAEAGDTTEAKGSKDEESKPTKGGTKGSK